MFEVFISSLQDSGFIVKASSEEEAVVKTIGHCKDKFPGMFCTKEHLAGHHGSLASDLHFCATNQVFLLDMDYPKVKAIKWS